MDESRRIIRIDAEVLNNRLFAILVKRVPEGEVEDERIRTCQQIVFMVTQLVDDHEVVIGLILGVHVDRAAAPGESLNAELLDAIKIESALRTSICHVLSRRAQIRLRRIHQEILAQV